MCVWGGRGWEGVRDEEDAHDLKSDEDRQTDQKIRDFTCHD